VSYDGLKMLNGGTLPLFESDLVFGLVGAMSDVVVVLDGDGTLHAVSSSDTRRSLGDLARHVGQPIATLLEPQSHDKLMGRLEVLRDRVAKGDKAAHLWCELNHVLPDHGTVPIRYSVHWLNAESRFLMLGRDQRPILELQQQLVSAQVALERDYEQQRELDTRYRLLMEVTRDPIIFVSTQTRRIVDLNLAAADLLGGARVELTGADIGLEFDGKTPSEFLDEAIAAATAETPQTLEFQARRSQKRLMLTPRVFRAAGERLLLCRLDDAARTPAASADPLGDNLRALYAQGIDGIVFTDREGTILSASESFLNLTDSATLSSVKGRSLADFLTRGTIDMKVLLENAQRAGHLRLYPTRLKTDFEGEIAVEISATRIGTGAQPIIALVVRDASRSEALRAPITGADANMVNVMDLVGSSSLKDIVAETTNVVEKLCIETAVELTRNNRVAAAEMLGLSRQSLYVKLRKYGLISRDED
jgi:transcriptional regulator PpsR